MAALSGPNLGVSYGWAARESGWNAGMDANLKLLDAVLQLSVKSRAVAVPPGTPANGDRYIVGASPSGAWAGKAAQVAVRIEGAWTGGESARTVNDENPGWFNATTPTLRPPRAPAFRSEVLPQWPY